MVIITCGYLKWHSYFIG